MKKLFVMSAIALALTGCATSNKVADNMVQIPQAKENSIPEWFLEKQTDNKSIFVTATDTSRDMQFAIDKAMLNAKIQLAERLGTRVESLVRESALETGFGIKDVEREIDRVSKVRVSQDLSFYTREHLTVVREDGFFRAFVMLKLTGEEGRRLTMKDKSATREEKFKELDDQNAANTVLPTLNVIPLDPASIPLQ